MSSPAFARPDQKPRRRVADRLKFLIAPPAILQTRMSKTANIITLIVARHTRGWDKPGQVMTREWALIPYYAFASALNVSSQMFRKARAEAVRAGKIEVRRGPGGTWEYKLALDYGAQEKTEVRRCNMCREISRQPLAQNLACIPPAYFLKFGKYATDAQFAVIGVIIGATMRVRPGKQGELFAGQHAAIDVSEIAAFSGVSERHIPRAIGWAVKHAGVSREEHPGRPTVYWIESEKFQAALKILTERKPRTLARSEPGAKDFEPDYRDPAHLSATPARELPQSNVISISKNFSLCLICGTFGSHKRVSPEVAARFEETASPRAGPGPPKPPKPAPKTEPAESETPDVLFDATWDLYVGSRARPLSAVDRTLAFAEWRKHPGKEQLILAYVRDQFATIEARWVPSLLRVLKEQHWTRVIEAPRPRPNDGSRVVLSGGVEWMGRYTLDEARRALANDRLEDDEREGFLEAFPELR